MTQADQGVPAHLVEAYARDGVVLVRDLLRLYHDHVLVKEAQHSARPGTRTSPTTTSTAAGSAHGSRSTRFPPRGCLEMVAGTHRGPWLMPRTFMTGEARWFPEGSLAELPDIEADRTAFDIRRYDLQPGDAVFFDFLTVHGAPGFPFRGRRRVLSLRYLSAEARHAPRRWRTSPPFEGLRDELPAGAALDHPLFPLVWQRGSPRRGGGQEGLAVLDDASREGAPTCSTTSTERPPCACWSTSQPRTRRYSVGVRGPTRRHGRCTVQELGVWYGVSSPSRRAARFLPALGQTEPYLYDVQLGSVLATSSPTPPGARGGA